ncbi:MAG: hypothetical protein QOF33_3545 [Thermomicrobiales bacterium]|nr:hypothetical protein [Thermomicrobiales bacterium]
MMSVRSSLSSSLPLPGSGPGFGACPVAAGVAPAVVGDWAPDEEANLLASDDDPLDIVEHGSARLRSAPTTGAVPTLAPHS